jgi:hypothetical protein
LNHTSEYYDYEIVKKIFWVFLFNVILKEISKDWIHQHSLMQKWKFTLKFIKFHSSSDCKLLYVILYRKTNLLNVIEMCLLPNIHKMLFNILNMENMAKSWNLTIFVFTSNVGYQVFWCCCFFCFLFCFFLFCFLSKMHFDTAGMLYLCNILSWFLFQFLSLNV